MQSLSLRLFICGSSVYAKCHNEIWLSLKIANCHFFQTKIWTQRPLTWELCAWRTAYRCYMSSSPIIPLCLCKVSVLPSTVAIGSTAATADPYNIHSWTPQTCVTLPELLLIPLFNQEIIIKYPLWVRTTPGPGDSLISKINKHPIQLKEVKKTCNYKTMWNVFW